MHLHAYLGLYRNLGKVLKAHEIAKLSRTLEPITRDIEEHIEAIRMLIRQKESEILNPKPSPEEKKLAAMYEISLQERRADDERRPSNEICTALRMG